MSYNRAFLEEYKTKVLIEIFKVESEYYFYSASQIIEETKERSNDNYKAK